MSQYFLIPSDKLADYSAYPMWFVSWSATDTTFCLSTVPPPSPDAIVCGLGAAANDLPSGAEILGFDGKDLPPPMSLPAPGSANRTAADFSLQFKQWLTARSANFRGA